MMYQRLLVNKEYSDSQFNYNHQQRCGSSVAFQYNGGIQHRDTASKSLAARSQGKNQGRGSTKTSAAELPAHRVKSELFDAINDSGENDELLDMLGGTFHGELLKSKLRQSNDIAKMKAMQQEQYSDIMGNDRTINLEINDV